MNAPIQSPDLSAPGSYLDGARLGRTEWWRFILAVIAILVTWFFLGSLPILFIAAATGGPIDAQGQLAGYPLLSFLGLMATFVALFIGIWGATWLFHGRPLASLVAPYRAVNWRRMLQGFVVWLFLAAAQAAVESLLYPGRYVWVLDARLYLQFLLPVLFLVPIQIAAEELLFRGYLLQWLGLRLRNIYLLSLLTGVLFGLLHMGNPEAGGENFWLMLLNYTAAGIFFALITLLDNGLELALGVHAANNLFAALVANYAVSALPTPALFTIQELDASFGLAAYLVGIILFLGFVILSRDRSAA